MSARLEFKFSAQPRQFEQWAANVQKDFARASTAAVTDAGNIALKDGRADIAAAGFPNKWQSGLRLTVFPKGHDAIDAAAVITHRIGLAGVFQEGAFVA